MDYFVSRPWTARTDIRVVVLTVDLHGISVKQTD